MNTGKSKRILCITFSVMIAVSSMLLLCSCDNKQSESNSTSDEPVVTTTAISTEDEATPVGYLKSIGIDTESLGIKPDVLHDKNRVGFQLEAPNEGDTIAILNTSMGNITIRFFPEQAPKTVTNFINLAKDGKYNNTLFSKATKDFMINGGYSGTSSYGTEFEDEFCDKLFNIRGAVAMSNTGKDSNESAFFINQKSADAYKAEGGWKNLEEQWKAIKTQLANYKDTNLLSAFIEKNATGCYNTDIVSDEIKKLYEENGGNAYLDGAYNAVDRGYTVFAQVIDGMDVVDKIANTEVDEDSIPVENIIIKSVKITTYSENSSEAYD